jgi:hypothetical protein
VPQASGGGQRPSDRERFCALTNTRAPGARNRPFPESAQIRHFHGLARLMLSKSGQGKSSSGREKMRNFDTFAGSAAWMAIALLMTAAALEPVVLKAQPPSQARALAVASCADGSAQLAMGCESIHL